MILGAAGVMMLLAAVAASAVQAGSWWPAHDLLSGGTGNAGLAADRGGGFLLVGRQHAAYCPAGAAQFGAPAAIPGSGMLQVASGSPTFRADGTASLVAVEPTNAGNDVSVTVADAASSAPQAFSRPLALATTKADMASFAPVVAAGNARGDLAAAGGEEVLSSSRGFAAVRPVGGMFPTPQQLVLRGGERSRMSVAIDGSGDTTVVWPGPTSSPPFPPLPEPTDVYYARAGGSFAPLEVPGGAPSEVPGSGYAAVASDAAGRTALAGYLPAGPQGAGLYLTRRESPAASFGTPLLLSASSRDPAPQLAYDAAGNLTIAWAEGDHVSVATAPPGAAPGVQQELSAPGTPAVSDERLAVDAAGEAMLAWAGAAHQARSVANGVYGTPAPIYAAIRLGGVFQAPQLVTTAAVYSGGDGVRVLDAIGSGRALVAWPTSGPGDPIQAALYAPGPGCGEPAVATATPTTTTPPALHGLAVRPSSLLPEPGRGASVMAGRRRTRGARVSYSDSEVAVTTFAVQRVQHGFRVGRRCAAKPPRHHKARPARCTRLVAVGGFTHTDLVGVNSLHFTGRVRGRPLKPGSYRLLATPRAKGKTGRTISVRFRVI